MRGAADDMRLATENDFIERPPAIAARGPFFMADRFL